MWVCRDDSRNSYQLNMSTPCKTEAQKCNIRFTLICCEAKMCSMTSPQAQKSSVEGRSLANVSLWSSMELMWSNRRERFWKTAQSKLGQSTGANENSHLSFREQGLCDWCWTFGGRPSAFNRRVALPVGCKEREREKSRGSEILASVEAHQLAQKRLQHFNGLVKCQSCFYATPISSLLDAEHRMSHFHMHTIQ